LDENFFTDLDDYKNQDAYEEIKLKGLGQVAGFFWNTYGNNADLVSSSNSISLNELNKYFLNISEVTDKNYSIMVEWIRGIRATNEFPENLISDDVLLKVVQESTEGLYNWQRKNKLKTTRSKKRPNDLCSNKKKGSTVAEVMMDYVNNHLNLNASDPNAFDRYLWLQPLRDEITKLNLEAYKAEHRANAKMSSVGIIEREKVDLEHQILDLEAKIEAEKKPEMKQKVWIFQV